MSRNTQKKLTRVGIAWCPQNPHHNRAESGWTRILMISFESRLVHSERNLNQLLVMATLWCTQRNTVQESYHQDEVRWPMSMINHKQTRHLQAVLNDHPMLPCLLTQRCAPWAEQKKLYVVVWPSVFLHHWPEKCRLRKEKRMWMLTN